MNTLLLQTDAWDLCLDALGNVALASDPYSISQDVASAIKLFEGEYWYDTTKGIPYWNDVLGKWPPISLMKAYFNQEAMTVPEVTASKCFLDSITNRTVTGQVQVTTRTGDTAISNFLSGTPQ